jgi:anionic cell wall polymer biosynthesis LytR-Cps2A-Psr (LCP) family protein
MLLLIDHAIKTITPLQSDRDTMTQITILGVLGGDAGTRNAQICLSHGFGDGSKQSCQLTREAVSNLLMGVGIDFFVAMDMDGISVLNDAVGGVPVTLDDDFSALDPAMRKGVSLTLHGDQAEYYVRNRRDIGIGTNERRMERQKVYLKALSEKLSAVFRDNRDFAGELYDALEPYLQTDMKRGRMINETWRTRDYAFSGIVQLEGKHSVGEDGFMEFHPDKAALQKTVVDLFYQAAR